MASKISSAQPKDYVRQLFGRVQNGDREAADLVIRTHIDIVEKIVQKHIKSAHNVAYGEIYQEGLIALYEAVRAFNADKTGSFYPYAYNLVNRRVERLVRSSTQEQGAYLVPEGCHDAIEYAELRIDLREALRAAAHKNQVGAQLSSMYFGLGDYQAASRSSIAQQTHKGTETVRKIIARFLAEVREELELQTCLQFDPAIDWPPVVVGVKYHYP